MVSLRLWLIAIGTVLIVGALAWTHVDRGGAPATAPISNTPATTTTATSTTTSSSTGTACATGVERCPDGSYVSRVAPSCAFAPCPPSTPGAGAGTSTGSDGVGSGEPVACAADAKLCPDGSYVSRVPPSCAFAACPRAASSTEPVTPPTPIVPYEEGVRGTVSVGPTCPVQYVGGDASATNACADRPLATSLEIVRGTDGRVVQTFTSSDDGTFEVSLPPGEYTVRQSADAPMLPRCGSVDVTVTPGAYAAVSVNCDSGIR